MTEFDYMLDGEVVKNVIEGNVVYGGPEVLLSLDDDLTNGTGWAEDGFTVQPFLESSEMQKLRDGMREIVRETFEKVGGNGGPEFTLEAYHLRGGSDPAIHAAFARAIKDGFSLTALPVDYHRVEERIGEIVGTAVTAHNRAFGLDVFNMRVVRPGSSDNNPLHRDVWLDRLRNAVNIYVPLAASDDRSSLPLVPGSHRWSESEIARTTAGAKLNGFSYTVPAVVGARRPIRLIRPNPAPHEVLVFSPYLIHGGALNRNPERTRVSLEMRFWRRS